MVYRCFPIFMSYDLRDLKNDFFEKLLVKKNNIYTEIIYICNYLYISFEFLTKNNLFVYAMYKCFLYIVRRIGIYYFSLSLSRTHTCFTEL